MQEKCISGGDLAASPNSRNLVSATQTLVRQQVSKVRPEGFEPPTLGSEVRTEAISKVAADQDFVALSPSPKTGYSVICFWEFCGLLLPVSVEKGKFL